MCFSCERNVLVARERIELWQMKDNHKFFDTFPNLFPPVLNLSLSVNSLINNIEVTLYYM